MTGQQILNAIPIVKKLTLIELPFKKAYQVYSLTKQINEKADFFINEEKKIINKFGGGATEHGDIQFPSAEAYNAFLKEHAEFMSCEIDDIAVITLSFGDLEGVSLSPLELSALDGLVEFVD